MVTQIYPTKLQLNKANSIDIEAPVLDFHLHLSISNGFLSSKMHGKRDDFDFDIVIFPFLDGGLPHKKGLDKNILCLFHGPPGINFFFFFLLQYSHHENMSI